ncbi:MAG: nucleotide exchange factor GrpE, partial [Acidobacteria bacterium]|nr:nucleotide exchange factor GrpE [Acidobacteriota bacterium]
MSVNNTTNEEIEDVDSSSVDNFIKQLEEKEKDLDISSDMVIEIGDSDVEHENIHDSFVAPASSSQYSFEDLSLGQPPVDRRQAERDAANTSKLAQDLVKIREERDHLKEALLRRQRDFDNYRNRTERERSESFRNVLAKLAGQIIPVVDKLNRALDAFSTADGDEKDFKTFLDGIVMVDQQLNDVLSDMGVKSIPAVGEIFDPQFHEAVETEV